MTLLAICRDDSKICTSVQDSGLFYKLYPLFSEPLFGGLIGIYIDDFLKGFPQPHKV